MTELTPHHDQALQQLFKRLPEEKPSAGFTLRVMEQIMLRQRATRRSRIAWAIAIPCLLALLLAVAIVTRSYWADNLLTFFRPLLTSLGSAFSSLLHIFTESNSPSVIIPGIAMFTLLLADLFLSRNVQQQEQLT